MFICVRLELSLLLFMTEAKQSAVNSQQLAAKTSQEMEGVRVEINSDPGDDVKEIILAANP